MTQAEFETYQQQWKNGYHTQFRLLDIDFRTYMVMKGMSEEEFEEKIKNVGK